MQQIHKELHKLRSNRTFKDKDIVQVATKNLIKNNKVLCFDEFQVDDVTDALILRKMFTYFFNKDINLLITSNIHPSKLYQDGLQREEFIKFVDQYLLKNCKVINLDNKVDYRTQLLRDVNHYFYPINKTNNQKFNKLISQITDDNSLVGKEFKINSRKLKVSKTYKNIAIFNFQELCLENLGVADYKIICSNFDIIFVKNIPSLSKEDRNEAKRFMLFIDEVYNHKVVFIPLCACAPKDIYREGIGSIAFARTVSRIQEMTSSSYIKSKKYI